MRSHAAPLLLLGVVVAQGHPLGAPHSARMVGGTKVCLARWRSVVPSDDNPILQAPVPSILDIFPQDLLDSHSRIKPIDIRRIEHDTFIDYEVEFIELPEEPRGRDIEESDNLVISHAEGEGGQDDPQLRLEGGGEGLLGRQGGDGLLGGQVDMESFVDLLQRARVRHRGRANTDR